MIFPTQIYRFNLQAFSFAHMAGRGIFFIITFPCTEAPTGPQERRTWDSHLSADAGSSTEPSRSAQTAPASHNCLPRPGSAVAAGTRMPACSEPCWPSAPARRGWGCAKPARRRRAPQLHPSAWPLLLTGTGASRAHPHLLHRSAVRLSPWCHPQGEA